MKRAVLIQDTHVNQVYLVVETNEPDDMAINVGEALDDYGGKLISRNGKIYDMPPEYYEEGWPGQDDGVPHPWESIYREMRHECGEDLAEGCDNLLHYRILFEQDPRSIGK